MSHQATQVRPRVRGGVPLFIYSALPSGNAGTPRLLCGAPHFIGQLGLTAF